MSNITISSVGIKQKSPKDIGKCLYHPETEFQKDSSPNLLYSDTLLAPSSAVENKKISSGYFIDRGKMIIVMMKRHTFKESLNEKKTNLEIKQKDHVRVVDLQDCSFWKKTVRLASI